MGEKYKLGEGDIAHTLFMGEQLGLGHRTTLKGNVLGNPPDTFWNTLKHLPDIPHTSPGHPRLRVEYKKLGGGGWVGGW